MNRKLPFFEDYIKRIYYSIKSINTIMLHDLIHNWVFNHYRGKEIRKDDYMSKHRIEQLVQSYLEPIMEKYNFELVDLDVKKNQLVS